MVLLSQESGEVLWSYCRDVPFFSSPNGATGHVLIGSVDGNICCLSSAGKPVSSFLLYFKTTMQKGFYFLLLLKESDRKCRIS